MNQPVIENNTIAQHITALVSTALSQSALSGLSEMLRVIAEAVDAYGCILWQVAPGANLNSNPPQGRLFVLAGWFADEQALIMHNLPLVLSAPGKAVLTGQTINIENPLEDERVYQGTPWLKKENIQAMCAIPIRFRDGAVGTVSLYRNIPRPFHSTETKQAEQLATLVPDLYQAIRDRVSENLIRRVISILHDLDLRSSESLPANTEITGVLQQICDTVAETFQCIETSVFLEDPDEASGKHTLMATTWPAYVPHRKDAYLAKENEGITGWVLANAREVKIFDLAYFERDLATIQAEYPNLTWQDSWDIKEAVRNKLKLQPNITMQPLSFMAAPLTWGNKVLGVIRCCTAKQGPYYFAERELGLLQLIAAQISRFWNNLLTHRRLKKENEAWQKLVRIINQLNSFVQGELEKKTPDEQRIFTKALEVTSSVMTWAEANDVRLHDRKQNDLYITASHGPAWDQGELEERTRRRVRRYSVLGQPRSAGAYVFQRRKVHIIPDVTTDLYYDKAVTLGTKRAIIAPIQVGNQIFGVLDIRGMGERAFPEFASIMTELLGEQLGLYHYLATTIGELHRAETEINQTFENLAHQLKGPITQLQARLQSILWGGLSQDQEKAYLQAACGLCGKARRVTMSTGILADLARENEIQLTSSQVQRLKYEWTIRMLVEAASDNERVLDPGRRISFDVKRQSFNVLSSIRVKADPNLLEQAVSCLLDNAGKYSYSDTKVEIFGGLTRKGEFYLSVINKGLPITPSEVDACLERGWRGEYAQLTTGEGSGIGLWVVNHIMKAHRGELEITPTTDGWTKVRLIFPVAK